MHMNTFPEENYCRSIVRFLDAIRYEDDNLTHDERVEGLRHVHSKTAKYFTEPLPRSVLEGVAPRRIAAVTRTISHFIINSDPSAQMATFWTDLIQGKQQKHPFWVLFNAHLSRCWIEQHNFQGYPGADCYPSFLRRLNCLGGAVAGTIFPAAKFNDQKLITEISCVMAQIDGPDEANLVTNWCTVDGITMDQALERLTDDTIHSCVRILEVFRDKDPELLATIRGFVNGYVTWHICDFRYRLREIYGREDLQESGVKFRDYFDKALGVGWVDIEEWTCQVDGFEVNGPAPKGSETQAYQTNAFAFSVDTPQHDKSDSVGSLIINMFGWAIGYLRGNFRFR
ncbi:Trichodiene synthase [Aspergillus cavernicola]|uniref:Trichodiene synthase n=1 Tax=Aspergillus cavernicola TaxID=176166 RepID=A0ABR4HWZ3_9EURO